MLSIKHEMFCQALIHYKGNLTEAYRATYPRCSAASAPSKASRLVKKGHIAQRVLELLEAKTGPMRDTAARELLQMFNAEKVMRCKGQVVYAPDNFARYRAFRTFFKLIGAI